MSNELDCRGLACPAPVLQTKELIERKNPAVITVVVDNEAARQNVSRFLLSRKFQVSTMKNGPDFEVTGTKTAQHAPAPETPSAMSALEERKKIMVMVATDRMGYGDDDLGKKLLFNFVKTLKEMGPDLWRLVLVNSGVTLAIEEAEALPILKELEDDGVTILVCGTCLTHFNLLEKKRVGETTNMLDIVTAMQLADEVINI
ncbi:MAG: sulfurtransferase-like selenium metabolism protein YedF [Deltaproteobacteria bacterium]|nr:sulfurtransferase-like selenium metabolism protein YedF [Deltaproteobacteria bacterium]